VNERQKELVEGVKQHAIAHYEDSFGWSEIVECFSDEEILEEFIAANRWQGEATTLDVAVSRAADYASLKEERYREAVGPDIECPECGTKFGENTACPNWAKHPSERDDASEKLERRFDDEG
jgi:hypothetical protein